jgi:hypothetical protein
MAVRLVIAAVLVVGGCSTDRDADRPLIVGSDRPVARQPDASSEQHSKRDELASMLSRGAVRLQLDARRSGVVVPAKYRTEGHLVLRVGYGLKPEIPDLQLDDRAISATLTFDGKPFHCVVPWAALFGAVVENEPNGTVWEDDLPADLPEAQDLRSHHTPPESSK